MLIIRTGLSESGAFEVSYNIYGGRCVPMFFAVWKQAPIKTTLLRDLDSIADATYITFEHAGELEKPLCEFLSRVAPHRRAWPMTILPQSMFPKRKPVRPNDVPPRQHNLNGSLPFPVDRAAPAPE
jgi:hypothetical protein